MSDPTYDIEALRARMLAHLRDNSNAYPCRLESDFPHVLARMVELWGSPLMDDYLQQLLVCDRPNRRGFPPEAASEIFQISVIHGALGMTARRQGEGWSAVTDADMERWRLETK